MNHFDIRFMKEALHLAEKAAKLGEVPVGAVIVDCSKDKVIATGYNQVEGKKNITLHAEIVALTAALPLLGSKFLDKCDIYITLEPCSMCLTALSYARIRRIYYGANEAKHGAVASATNIFYEVPALYKPEIYGGICLEESSNLLKKFFQNIKS